MGLFPRRHIPDGHLACVGRVRLSWKSSADCKSLTFDRYIFALFQTSVGPDAKETQRSVVRSIPTYLSLLIFGFFYQLILVYDALHNQNTIQVIGLCMYNVGILIYTAIQTDQIRDAVLTLQATNNLKDGHGDLYNNLKPYLVALPCVIALCTILLSGIAWKLYEEFAWNIYKQISADLRLKRRFLIYQVRLRLPIKTSDICWLTPKP